MKRKGMFESLVFFVEACYSASMFEGFEAEASAMEIYVQTAANATESSWATYCP